MTTYFRAEEIHSQDLTESFLAPPSAEPLSGEIKVRSHLAFATEGNEILSGIWESDPGTSRWEFLTRGEIITVLEGRMTVTEDGTEPCQLTAGDTAYFPVGWTGQWTIHEPLRKIFVVFAASNANAGSN